MYKIYQLNPRTHQAHHIYQCPTETDALKQATYIAFAGYLAIIASTDCKKVFIAEPHTRPHTTSLNKALSII